MVIVVLFALFYWGNLFFGQSAVTAAYKAKYAAVLVGIIIILLSTMKIYRLFKQDRSGNLFDNPVFWACCGFGWFWLIITPITAFLDTPGDFSQLFYRIFYYLIFTVSLIIQNTCIIKSLQCSLNKK